MRNGDKVKRPPPYLPEGFDYIQRDWTRHGKARYFYRRPGYKLTRLSGLPGSDEFAISYGAAIAAGPIKTVADPAAEHGTMGWLVGRYLNSLTFLARPESVQAPHKRALDKIKTNVGAKPVSTFDRGNVEAILAKLIATPAKANEWRKALIDMFDWAVEEKHMPANPAAKVRKLKRKKGGFHLWTPAEVEAYCKRHPEGTQARLAFEIMYREGFRASDAIRAGHASIIDGGWSFTQHKNREHNPVERRGRVNSALLVFLKATPSVSGAGSVWSQVGGPFLRSETGKPYTRGGFTKAMRRWCDEAGLPECTAHGIRKRVGNDLAQSGATTHEIMAVLGHGSEESARPYTLDANRELLADAAAGKRARSTRKAAGKRGVATAEIVTPATL